MTDEIVCPWCGYVHRDSWEYPDEATVECMQCDQKFNSVRWVDVSYSTERVAP